ncbi:MAG TPA: hypothetical protein VLU95_01510 [Candidatus Acidoferrum sp.]|nr:hypothetical protein [Candidatus Acidoferrum sp.]
MGEDKETDVALTNGNKKKLEDRIIKTTAIKRMIAFLIVRSGNKIT